MTGNIPMHLIKFIFYDVKSEEFIKNGNRDHETRTCLVYGLTIGGQSHWRAAANSAYFDDIIIL